MNSCSCGWRKWLILGKPKLSFSQNCYT